MAQEHLQSMMFEIEQKFQLVFSKPKAPQSDDRESQGELNNNPESSTLQVDLSAAETKQQEGTTHPNSPEHEYEHLSEVNEVSSEKTLFEIEESPEPLFSNKQVDSPIVSSAQGETDQSLSRKQSNDKPIILSEQTSEVEDREDLISYHALTEKFEMALSRIKHNTASVSDFAARQQNYLTKKNSDLDLLRLEREKQEKIKCSGKPLINSKSQQLLSHYTPIHHRYKEVLEEKEKRVKMGLAQKKSKEIEEEEIIVREMEQHQRKIKEKHGSGVRTKEDYYDWMKSWSQVRDKKVEELAAKRGKVCQEEATFKPQLNQKSQIMMKKKKERVPIYQKEPQPRKVGVDSNCTFKPNLNKTFKK